MAGGHPPAASRVSCTRLPSPRFLLARRGRPRAPAPRRISFPDHRRPASRAGDLAAGLPGRMRRRRAAPWANARAPGALTSTPSPAAPASSGAGPLASGSRPVSSWHSAFTSPSSGYHRRARPRPHPRPRPRRPAGHGDTAANGGPATPYGGGTDGPPRIGAEPLTGSTQ